MNQPTIKKVRNPKTGKYNYIVNGKWVFHEDDIEEVTTTDAVVYSTMHNNVTDADYLLKDGTVFVCKRCHVAFETYSPFKLFCDNCKEDYNNRKDDVDFDLNTWLREYGNFKW